MESHEFENDEKLLQHLREHSDSYDKLQFYLSENVVLTAQGRTVQTKELGGVLIRCDGGMTAISRKALELLLNDGICNRMNIPIEIKNAQPE